MQIEVTAEDIAAGARRSAHHCPIANALERTTRLRWLVSPLGVCPLDLTGQAIPPLLALPATAQVFIESYDRGSAVEPFTFEFPVPV